MNITNYSNIFMAKVKNLTHKRNLEKNGTVKSKQQQKKTTKSKDGVIKFKIT